MEPIASMGEGVGLPAGRAGTRDRVRETAQEFEGVFLGLLLKAMRPAGGKGGLFTESADTQAYRELFDQEIGRGLAKAGGIGLAHLILRDQALREAAAAGAGRVATMTQKELKGSSGAADTTNDSPVPPAHGGSGEDQR